MADTHIPRRARDLPAGAWEVVSGCDVVLHAGDVVDPSFLDDLAAVVPVHAVRGNNDLDLPGLPERLEVDLGGTRVAMVHDSGPSAGRRARLRGWFPAARVVVYGHSHIPFLEDDGDLLVLNPGSPTDRRRMPTFTMAVLDLGPDGPRADLVDLGRERADRGHPRPFPNG
jgi:putative phosphoesterase